MDQVQNQLPELLLGDFKRFTSRSIIKLIKENPRNPCLQVRIGEAEQKRIFIRLF